MPDVMAGSGARRGSAPIPDTLAFLAFCSRFKISRHLRAVGEGSLLILLLAERVRRNVRVRRAQSRIDQATLWRGERASLEGRLRRTWYLVITRMFHWGSQMVFLPADISVLKWRVVDVLNGHKNAE